ncbi:MAG: Flp1 family type IVb pilin [Syntrophomonadaceae bacterium]
MLKAVKKFWQDEEGMGTLEVIIIVAALVAVGLLFRSSIKQWVQGLLNKGQTATDAVNFN